MDPNNTFNPHAYRNEQLVHLHVHAKVKLSLFCRCGISKSPPLSLISALDEAEWESSRPCRFSRTERLVSIE